MQGLMAGMSPSWKFSLEEPTCHQGGDQTGKAGVFLLLHEGNELLTDDEFSVTIVKCI
jgi:hypothetical protein